MLADSISSVKLYHPRGPLVTLAVPADPKAAFAHVVSCLDAGFLTRAPGLELGEDREDVGFVLRSECQNGDGSTTPYLFLYAAAEPNRFAFVKVYLNTPQDIAAFEYAAKMKLNEFPEYEGTDKPERGRSSKTDRYIVPVKKPFGVIYKHNPKHSDAERAVIQAKGEVYRVPARIFIRWADRMPQPASSSSQAQTPAKSPAQNSPRPHHALSPAEPSIEQQHKLVMDAYAVATTEARVKQWQDWADNIDFPNHHVEAQSDARNAALERINKGKQCPQQPHGRAPRQSA